MSNPAAAPVGRRTRIWIDAFQTRLLAHVLAYCVLYQAAVWTWVTVWNQFAAVIGASVDEPLSTTSILPNVLCFAILAPIICFSALRFAHRFVGPIVPFRRAIRAVKNGTPVELVRLRKGDYLIDMRDEFNAMLEELERRGAIAVHRPGNWKENTPSVGTPIPTAALT
jgi:hypothetical protein